MARITFRLSRLKIRFSHLRPSSVSCPSLYMHTHIAPLNHTHTSHAVQCVPCSLLLNQAPGAVYEALHGRTARILAQRCHTRQTNSDRCPTHLSLYQKHRYSPGGVLRAGVLCSAFFSPSAAPITYPLPSLPTATRRAPSPSERCPLSRCGERAGVLWRNPRTLADKRLTPFFGCERRPCYSGVVQPRPPG